eukprot:Rmarinus@m.18561
MTGQQGYSCTKHAQKSKDLTPGVFIISCLDCKRVIGWTVLRQAESLRTLFEILMTRWKVMPEVIIYDAACRFESYCLNREPERFKHTRFFIDDFHIRNHKRCSPAYEVKQHAEYGDYATSFAEQVNSRLNRIVGSLSFMKQKNFLVSLRYFMYRLNTDGLGLMKDSPSMDVSWVYTQAYNDFWGVFCPSAVATEIPTCTAAPRGMGMITVPEPEDLHFEV